jgi:predicted double-glycine peptidase
VTGGFFARHMLLARDGRSEPVCTKLCPMLIRRKLDVFAARRLAVAVCAAGVFVFPPTVWAANIGIGSGLRIEPSLQSMKDLRDRNVVKQRFDYSCGAAALATILRYGFGDDVTERDILAQLFRLESETQKQVSEREGFSLLDLQLVAQNRNYNAEGFRITAQDLPRLSGSIIVYIQPRGYKHFAVLRGIIGDRVYLADPSLGNIRMPLYAFLESWRDISGTGVIFVVEPNGGQSSDKTPLNPVVKSIPQLEIMTVREKLAVGNPFLALPELSR